MNRFVRMDQKIGAEALTEKEFEDHLRFMERSAKERTMMAGGFVGDPGGMVVFEAKTLQEAKEWARRDPLFATGKYAFQMYEWKVVFNT